MKDERKKMSPKLLEKTHLKTRSTRRRTTMPTRTGGRAPGQTRTGGRTAVLPTVHRADCTAVRHCGTTVRLLQLSLWSSLISIALLR